jgi:hypothetical protein
MAALTVVEMAPPAADRVCSRVVRTLEQIVEHIRAAAGADFAFVLTRKGRLVTHRAPRDMPDEGRHRLVRAAQPLLGTDRIIEVTLPREELVPFGGAAPVDVYVGVVAEQAIVCAVMASWADKMRVAAEMEAGMRAIAPLLRRGLPTARRSAVEVEPAKGSPYLPDRAPSVPPPPDSAPFIDLRASLIPEVPGIPGVPGIPRAPRIASLPEITLGEAPLGRESLVAVRRDAASGGSAPEITVGEAALGRGSLAAIELEIAAHASLPDISIGEAALGRESLAAIRRETAGVSLPEITLGEAALGRESLAAIRRETVGVSLPEITLGEAALGRASMAAIELDDRGGRPRPSSSPESIRVDLVSMPEIEVSSEGDRATLPWVEPAADAKRATDAARLGRKLSPPKVSIKLEDAEVIEAERPARRR